MKTSLEDAINEIFNNPEKEKRSQDFLLGYTCAINRISYLFQKLNKENIALRQLLEWAEECDFGFDQIAADDNFDYDKFFKETKGMNYIDSLIYYAERWIEKNEQK